MPPSGVWSGDRATLTLTATGGSFVEDCADATVGIPAWRKDGKRFTATGSRAAFHGGPQRADEPGDISSPVEFNGTLHGDTLELVVRGAGQPPTTYRLRPGINFKRIRCL